MLHGNVLLRGWAVSDVSFCITELPEYLVLDMVRGPGPDVGMLRQRSHTRCWCSWLTTRHACLA